MCHVANVYLHYLQTCFKGYDGKFRFESVVVLKETMSWLPESANERFAKQNLQMEKWFFFSLFLTRIWIHCLVYAKKDDPLDKYKFKVNNRYSSWKEE